jgi:hypothetical protein
VNSGPISYRQEKILQFPPQISYRQEFHFWNCRSRDNQSADFQDLTDFTRAIGEISSDSHPLPRLGRYTTEWTGVQIPDIPEPRIWGFCIIAGGKGVSRA